MNRLEKKLLLDLLRIRMIEEEISKKYSQNEMRCPVHLSLGQEAIAVGVCNALKKNDHVYSTHRCHSHYLAKGGNLNRMIAEIYGKQSGCCGGKGGSMHLIDKSCGFMLSLPIVGSIIPISIGASFAFKLRKEKKVSVVFFGDAAVEEGVYHESANFASLHNLPIIFVCENNMFSCFTHLSERQPSKDLTRLAKCHNIKSLNMSGNNVSKIYEKCLEIVDDIKKNPRPFFLQLNTYRNIEHCGPNDDDYLNYRENREKKYWQKNDPIENYITLLKKSRSFDKSIFKKFKKIISSEIDIAFSLASKDKFPNKSLLKNIYA